MRGVSCWREAEGIGLRRFLQVRTGVVWRVVVVLGYWMWRRVGVVWVWWIVMRRRRKRRRSREG